MRRPARARRRRRRHCRSFPSVSAIAQAAAGWQAIQIESPTIICQGGKTFAARWRASGYRTQPRITEEENTRERASERATKTGGKEGRGGARAALEADGKVSAHLPYLAWESDISIADVVEAGTC